MSDATDFLSWLRPSGPWVLTAIHPDKSGASTQTLTRLEDCVTFIESNGNAGRNLYYSVNSTNKPLSKKPSRADVRDLDFIHVDIDPRPGTELAEERARILRMLIEQLPPGVPAPSAIIDSGGGYQALWRLVPPLPVNGEEVRYEEAARYNQQIEMLFGGDNCHNVDRILRLPGTTNFPDARKRAKGRVVCQATAVVMSDSCYDIKSFTPVPKLQVAGVTYSAGRAKVSGNVRRLQSLDELPAGVTPLTRLVISHGFDPANPEKWSDRSRALWHVCCELVRQGVDDETIFSIITDREWRISESVLERGTRAERYALDQIDRAHEEVIQPELREMNDKYCVLMHGGRCRVMTEKEDKFGTNAEQRRTRIELMPFDDLKHFHMNRFVLTTNARQQTVRVPLGDWWLAQPGRRQYDELVFCPGTETPGSYNMWKGFSVSPRPNPDKIARYLDHLRENICVGNTEHYDYLIRWMARAVQLPGEPGQTAIVLRGKQGTGKNRFAEIFGSLFGRHFLSIHDSNHLFGQFVLHLRDCCVLLANEAFWAGNKKQEGMLKSLVTEPTLMIEGKGTNAIIAQNCLHLIMASNEEWVVPAGHDDRRFFVLDVGLGRKNDTAYFQAMTDDMASGGKEALLHYLLTLDLSGWDVRKIPQTRGLRQQKILSYSNDEAWWFGKLMSGRVFEDSASWSRLVPVSNLLYDYRAMLSAKAGRSRAAHTMLGMFLDKATRGGVVRRQLTQSMLIKDTDGTLVESERPRVYVLPSLEDCRAAWDADYGGPHDWPEDDLVVENETLATEPAKQPVL